MRARVGALAAAVVFGLLGVGSVGGALVLASSSPPSPTPASSPAATASPEPRVTSTPTAQPDSTQSTVKIAELASPEWVSRVALAAGIPERALFAYAGAALVAGREHPSCGIGWNTVAAIGLVESEHGSMNGGRLADSGLVDPAIIGIALDGAGVEAIPDTDSGVLDGDTVWDRAVGPMQFIPSTWHSVGRDGNGDGIASAHNIDDAAYSAAMHLCEVGGDLRVSENWIAAIGAYNASAEYNNRVAQAATQYAKLG